MYELVSLSTVEGKESDREFIVKEISSLMLLLSAPPHSVGGMIGFPLTGSLSSHQLGRKGRIRTLSALEFPSTTKSDSRASSSEAKLEKGLSSCNFIKAKPRFESRKISKKVRMHWQSHTLSHLHNDPNRLSSTSSEYWATQ